MIGVGVGAEPASNFDFVAGYESLHKLINRSNGFVSSLFVGTAIHHKERAIGKFNDIQHAAVGNDAIYTFALFQCILIHFGTAFNIFGLVTEFIDGTAYLIIDEAGGAVAFGELAVDQSVIFFEFKKEIIFHLVFEDHVKTFSFQYIDIVQKLRGICFDNRTQ